MGLADFIRAHTGAIVTEWEAFAQTLVPASDNMSPLALRNHIEQILEFIVGDIQSPQTPAEEVTKSHGGQAEPARPSAASIHASLRYDGGFDMDQMVSEYRALRASIVRLWYAAEPDAAARDTQELTRFHEAIDQALTESIHDYTEKVAAARNLFLSILSHDLRNPLGAISMSAQLTPKMGELNTRQIMLQSQIVESARRASEIIVNLLDLTRARLGSGLPIIRGAMDMGFVANRLVDEMRARYPERSFLLKTGGDLRGVWDKARIGQVFSNLLGNAIEHGFVSTPVTINVEGTAHEVIVSIHNNGEPIKPETLASLFNAVDRTAAIAENSLGQPSIRLGLGLFICHEIVEAHGGSISVVSTESEGTLFTVRFPRSSGAGVIELPQRPRGLLPGMTPLRAAHS